ncbi:hypothetical protein [Streptomyces kronopolitis]|uniref:hypothetical protein n=1 Tax=Streptomyces kronopolitis TaxID=1612435 RepID=UPI00166D71D5|nr:hypothetical protein [Streptomyces kronopolitis]
MADFEELPIAPGERRDALRLLVAGATRRYWKWRLAYTMQILMTPMLFLFTFPILLLGTNGNPRTRGICLAVVVTYVWGLVWRTVLHREFMARLLFIGSASSRR